MITALKQVDTIPNILFPWEPHWTLSTVISMTVYWKMGKLCRIVHSSNTEMEKVWVKSLFLELLGIIFLRLTLLNSAIPPMEKVWDLTYYIPSSREEMLARQTQA